MKIPEECKIEGVVSADVNREELSHLMLLEGGWLEATDGRMIARIKVASEDDQPGMVPTKAIAYARQQFPALDAVEIVCKEAATVDDGTTFVRPQGKYPDTSKVYAMILPEEKYVTTIALNAEFLFRLACALGGHSVVLQIATPIDPIKVCLLDQNEAVGLGLLMPIKIKG